MAIDMRRGFPEIIQIAAIAASEVEDAPRMRDLISDRGDRRFAAAKVKLAVTIALREAAEILRDVADDALRACVGKIRSR